MLFVLVIGVPLVGTLYLSLTKWSGIGDPRWVGLDNYQQLLHDDVFWASFRNTVWMLVAMVVVPTVLGLLLAAVLFDVIGRRFKPRTAAALRAAFYLRRCCPSWWPASSGAGSSVPTERSTVSSTRSVSARSATTGSATRAPLCRP
ncbi:hypothetical protein NKG94_49635 [Micromonospora sp. M12]